QRAVGDVAPHEYMARIALERLQILQVAGVSELVEIDDRLAGFGDRGQDEVGADESRAAGDQEHPAIIPLRSLFRRYVLCDPPPEARAHFVGRGTLCSSRREPRRHL